MDQMRLIFAILASLLALVFVAVWFAKGRQHSTRGRGGALIYAILLFASSGILLLKSRDEFIARTASPRVMQEIGEPLKEAIPDSARAEIQSKVKRTEVPKHQEQEQIATWTKTKLETHGSVRQSNLTQSQPLRISSSQNSPISTSPVSNKMVEDVIEAGILNAFDVIEVFFETYGIPVVSSSAAQSSSTAASIEFVTGSAELSLRSLQLLQILAEEFSQKYEHGQLEIRAQTNETVNSPELRRQLTQSRAEAVRDVLAAQGFPASRMVPIGSEKAGNARVKFVHRPN